MMKAGLIFAVVLVIITVGQISAEVPKPIDFVVEYSTSGALGADGLKSFNLLSDVRFTDGYDGELKLYTVQPISIAVRKVSGIGGWDSDTDFYINDDRPSPAAGQSIIFEDIYMWALPGTASQDMLLEKSYVQNIYGWIYKLELVSIPAGVTYNGPREWGLGHGVITLPFFATDDGIKGYKFRAEVTAVPEPSSFLALAGGLIGVGGLALRRKKN